MEFLKTCNTNAQAIGDFEAVAYHAFSISRTIAASSPSRDWSTSDDIRAVEALLRQDILLVSQDASRPWLWVFKPAAKDTAGQAANDPPHVDGYRLHSEHAGSIKSSELARPPQRTASANAAFGSMNPPPTGLNKGLQGGGARLAPGQNQANAPDQQQPIDCFALYELFTSSVIALISYFLVKDCNAVALNFRTFLSRTPPQQHTGDHSEIPSYVHWLTSVNVHWTSSGTLIVSTTTGQRSGLRCIDEITSAVEQKHILGTCIRIAPSGMLARVASFDDPLDTLPELPEQRQKKRARTTTLEQNITKWKSAVTRWLGWKGYHLPDLQKKESWLRIRASQSCTSVASGTHLTTYDRDILWPRVLCILLDDKSEFPESQEKDSASGPQEQFSTLQRWFETSTSSGFKDPLDLAQDWALGKVERERILDVQQKAKKAEEDALRRKEEQSGLFASSPVNARTGTYGDLQAVSGVYPTPPDGMPPGTAVSQGDTPSVTGAVQNIVLAPGSGPNPAINLSAPQDYSHGDMSQMQTSPNFPPTLDNAHNSSSNDDLFGDMEDDGYEANDIDDADFDFFDAQDDNDVDMLDAPALNEMKPPLVAHDNTGPPAVSTELEVKEEMSDPFTALENALTTASEPEDAGPTKVEAVQPQMIENEPDHKSLALSTAASAAQTKNDTAASKEPTPPLSPSRVAAVLQPSPPRRNSSRSQSFQKPRLGSETSFDPLHFNRRMSLADAKYQDGRFSSHNDMDKKNEPHHNSPPTTIKSLKDVPLMTKLRYAMGVASASKLPEIASLARADSDDSDSSSETSEGSEEEFEGDVGVSPTATMTSLVLPAKRKLPTEGNRTPMSVTSFAESLAFDYYDAHGLQLDDTCLTLLDSSPWDWSLVSARLPAERPLTGSRFDMPGLPPPGSYLPDTPTSQPDFSWETFDEKAMNLKDRISVTQIVTDQLVLATLDLLGEDDVIHHDTGTQLALDTCWHSTIKTVFPGAVDCDMSALAAVHEVFPDLPAHAKSQQRPPTQRQPNDGPVLTRSHIYPIQAPYLRVRRADTQWDLLPPAIAFWEPLGLSPVSPAKNVISFCVYPHSDSIRPCLETFMLNLQLAYDSCKFGSHARVETVVEFEGGMIPWKLDNAPNAKELFTHLRDTCVQLGKLLAIQHSKIREQQDAKVDAFVIYMVDPVGGSTGLWELCSAFWALFHAYGQHQPGRPDQSQKPDVVLQVVPIKYIASTEAPVILDPSTYLNLAREVYDRCPPSAPCEDRTALGIYAAPAFQLEESLPRNIPFKLISEPPQDLIRENSYLHVGYAVSLDGTWLTAAWTDNCGKSQTVASYHLGTRSFSEIAQEIWQTTIEIAQARRVQWRICVAKAGAMEKEELETWSQIITRPTSINLFITMLTIDLDPPLRLTPTVATNNNAVATTNTPGSTPQPGVSPDPSAGLTPAATPSADPGSEPSADPDARLIDITDETWGVILAHRLHNSNSTNVFSPAVVSGLLVKRGTTFATSSSTSHLTPDPEPGPIVIAINILWIGAVGSTRAATSPFPPTDAAGGTASTPQSPAGTGPQDAGAGGPRTSTSLNWTPTPQSRATAESLLKEAMGQYRALGLLAKLRGMRGTKGGSVPWHVAAAVRGARGVGMVVGGLPF